MSGTASSYYGIVDGASQRNPPMFRFTIRDVLWLTVVVALALGWWLNHVRTRRELREARSAYADLTTHWNNLIFILKYHGVTVESPGDMIHWKGKSFPVDFNAPVDPTPGNLARMIEEPSQGATQNIYAPP
jgi:hypothetical protein